MRPGGVVTSSIEDGRSKEPQKTLIRKLIQHDANGGEENESLSARIGLLVATHETAVMKQPGNRQNRSNKYSME